MQLTKKCGLILYLTLSSLTAFTQIQIESWVNHQPDLSKKELLVLEFWATWCAPCIKEIPRINDLVSEFSPQVAFVGISNEPEEKIRAFLNKKTVQTAVAKDCKGKTFYDFNVSGVPRAFIFNAKGKALFDGHTSLLTENLIEV